MPITPFTFVTGGAFSRYVACEEMDARHMTEEDLDNGLDDLVLAPLDRERGY